MRTSLLSRSVIAVASLSIGSVALATHATAAVPDGVTRDLVLSVTQILDRLEPDEDMSAEQREAVELLISKSCAFEMSGDSGIDDFDFAPFVNGAADGVLITARLHHEEIEDVVSHTYCTFGTIATPDAAFTLDGTFELGTRQGGGEAAARGIGGSLSGNADVSRPLHSLSQDSAEFTASGLATGSVNVTTTDNVSIIKPRTAPGEKASKAKYDKRLKAAAKWYAKKIQKAGNSKSKKAAAKKAYAKKKAAYKLAYDKRYFGIRSDSTKTIQTESRPFHVAVSIDAPQPQ